MFINYNLQLYSCIYRTGSSRLVEQIFLNNSHQFEKSSFEKNAFKVLSTKKI